MGVAARTGARSFPGLSAGCNSTPSVFHQPGPYLADTPRWQCDDVDTGLLRGRPVHPAQNYLDTAVQEGIQDLRIIVEPAVDQLSCFCHLLAIHQWLPFCSGRPC